MSREFVSRTREHLIDLMSRPLDDLRPTVVMLDGIDLKGRCIVALGIDTGSVKPPLGLWDGLTENAAVATTLLSNLVERLDGEQSVLVVFDGARAAWAIDDHHRALDQRRGLASELDRSHSARPRHCARALR